MPIQDTDRITFLPPPGRATNGLNYILEMQRSIISNLGIPIEIFDGGISDDALQREEKRIIHLYNLGYNLFRKFHHRINHFPNILAIPQKDLVCENIIQYFVVWFKIKFRARVDLKHLRILKLWGNHWQEHVDFDLIEFNEENKKHGRYFSVMNVKVFGESIISVINVSSFEDFKRHFAWGNVIDPLIIGKETTDKDMWNNIRRYILNSARHI